VEEGHDSVGMEERFIGPWLILREREVSKRVRLMLDMDGESGKGDTNGKPRGL